MSLTITNDNPLKVTGTTSTSQAITTDNVGLKFVYWYNPTTSGHLCNLVDSAGDPILPMRANSANDTQMWPVFKYVDGIYCDDMDSGTLYLYLR